PATRPTPCAMRTPPRSSAAGRTAASGTGSSPSAILQRSPRSASRPTPAGRNAAPAGGAGDPGADPADAARRGQLSRACHTPEVATVLILVIIGAAAFLQSLSGFGFSLLAVPLLALVVSAKSAVV